jgi:hypothetical protein
MIFHRRGPTALQSRVLLGEYARVEVGLANTWVMG